MTAGVVAAIFAGSCPVAGLLLGCLIRRLQGKRILP